AVAGGAAADDPLAPVTARGRLHLVHHPFDRHDRCYFSGSCSHELIVEETISGASFWTKWPTPGIVTSVSVLSSHCQVLFNIPGNRAVSFRPCTSSTGALTLTTGEVSSLSGAFG